MKQRLKAPKFLFLMVLFVLTLTMPLYAQHPSSANQHPPLTGYPESSVSSVSPIGWMSSGSTLHQNGNGSATSAGSFSTRSMPQMGSTFGNAVPLSRVGATTAPQLSAIRQATATRPKKIGGGGNYNDDDDPGEPIDNPDPFPTPLGDLPLLLILLLCVGYARRRLRDC